MNKALNIARYVINYCNDRNIEITNLKLQKLLYFIQANFIIEINEFCFGENFIAWEYGPIILTIYNEFKKYGRDNIPKFEGQLNEIYHKDIIDAVLQEISQKDPFELVKISHKQSPWQDAYIAGYGSNITKESIKKFFSEN